MKKSLSLLLAIALVFGMFSGLAFAAEKTPGEILKDAGVLQGNGTDLQEDQTWLRQNVAVLLSRLYGAEDEAKATAKNHTFADVKNSFYDGYITWAKAEGLMNGKSTTKFGYGEALKAQEFAAVILRVLDIDAEYSQALNKAIEAGILPAGTQAAAKITRGETFEGLVNALNTEVSEGVTLGASLGLKGFVPEKVAVKSAAQTGAKKIVVKFTASVKADAKVELKKGLVPYSANLTWNKERTEVTMETGFALSAGDYTVAVTDLEAVTVAVAAEKATAVVINSNVVQNIANSKLDFALNNQFGEKMTTAAANFTVAAFNKTNAGRAVTITPSVNDLIVNASAANKDDKVIITLAHTATGLNTSKEVTVVDQAAASLIDFTEVKAPGTDSRIYVSKTGVELKYNIVDQYGATVTLDNYTDSVSDDTAVIQGIRFVTSNPAIVDADSFAVTSGKLTFATGATAGTVTITAIVLATGDTAVINVVVENVAGLKTFQVSAPASIVAAKEDVKIPYAAANQFGEAIATKDLDSTVRGSHITFASSNAAVIAASDFSFNANNELVLNATGKGTAIVYVYVDGVLQNSVNFVVEEKAVATRITGVKDLPRLFENTATFAINKDNIQVVDQYNRAYTLTVTDTVYVAVKDGTGNNVALTGSTFSTTGSVTLTGTNTPGTEVFTLKVNNLDASVAEISVGSIATADIKTYELAAVSTLYAHASHTAASNYAVELKLTGKDATGSVVQLASNKITAVTSSSTAFGVDSATKEVYATAKGTGVVAVWNGATQLASVSVTSDDAAPVATTVKFTEATLVVANNLTGSTLVSAKLEVKDQYGVAITPVGYWTSNNAAVTINASTGAITTGGTDGKATVGFVSSNGKSATIEVEVR